MQWRCWGVLSPSSQPTALPGVSGLPRRRKTNGVLCVNVLTGGHQSTSGAFANRQLTMQERFSSVNCQTLVTGSPVIAEALVSLDCRVAKIDEVGTHSIFYCEILELQHSEATEGLVYFNRNYYRLNDELRLAPDQ